MVLRENIDCNPYTGVRTVKGKLRVKTDGWLKPYFNGADRYEQVHNVTMGKVYDVIRVEGLGDCEDVTIIDDLGNETELADFFFEEVE